MTGHLIDEVLEVMSKEYRPGLISWLERYPDKWTKVLKLEHEINQAALSNDRGSLVIALGNYRLFFKRMTDLFEGDTVTHTQAQDAEATPQQPTHTRTGTGERQVQDMKVSRMFPSKYLSKDDLPEPEVFTIDTVEMDLIQNEDGKEEKPILYFADDRKPLILNKTNAEILASEFGPDSDDWVGQDIELYVDPSIRFGKQKIGGIRVRVPDTSTSKEAVL